jgi:hypothetical protein
MSGGFAGGLASGLSNGMQLYNQKKYYDGLNQYREDLNTIREENATTKAAGKKASSSEDEDGFWNTIAPIFKTGGSGSAASAAPQQQPVMIDPNFKRMPGFAKGGLVTLEPRRFAAGGMIPDAVFSGNAPAAYQAGSLASVQGPAPAQPVRQAQPEEPINPRQEIVKQMMFGNLANDPDKLNAIQAAAVAHGMGDKITPWLEGMYKAKKRGIFDGAMNLLNNNVDGAIDDLKRGGISLQDRPVKVNPDDPNDTRWKINVSGTGERIMDVKNMIGSTMDADKFLKWQNDMNESTGKRNVSDSQVLENQSNIKVNDARVGKLNEETKNVRAERSGGLSGAGLGKLPAPAATAQWLVQNGVYPDHKTAFNAVKTLNDKSPAAARMELVQSILKGGMVTPEEAIKQADQVMSAMGRSTAPRINKLPDGAKQIGTSGGKPVYEVNGRRFIAE